MNNTILLKQAASYVDETTNLNDLSYDNFVTVDNLLQNKAGRTNAIGLPPKGNSFPSYKAGDILIGNIRPYLKKIWFADRDGGSTQDVLILRANAGYIPKYLYYALFRDDFFVHMMNGKKGTKMPRGDKNQVLEFLIPNYPISIQQNIAVVLSSLDAKIELNNRINAELESMAKTLYDYWFVQFDFPDENGKPYKSSGGKMVWDVKLKREIPDGWYNSNILAVSDLYGGGTPSKKKKEYWGGNIPFFTPTDANSDIYINLTEDQITKEGLDNCSSDLFSIGTIFITARGSVGKLMIIASEMAMNQSCYALKVKKEVSSVYLYFLAKELIHHLQVKSSGSVFDSIVSNDIKFTYLSIPQLQFIKEFSKIADPFFNQILLNTKQNEQLASLRDWLLPMLMNGQVKVG